MFKALVYFDENKAYPWITDSSATSMAGYAAMAADPYLNGYGSHPVPDPDPATPGRRGRPQQQPERRSARAHRSRPGERVVGRPFDEVRVDERCVRSRTTGTTRSVGSRPSMSSSPNGDSYYGWSGTRYVWFGRLYVRLKALPVQNLRLIRAASEW